MKWSPWRFIVTCRPYRNMFSRGIWLKDNPFTYSAPTFMMQIALSTLFTGSFDVLLRPLGLCSFCSQMLGAIVLGPWGIGNLPVIQNNVFSLQSLYVLDTVSNLGGIFFLFLMGLKMDVRILKNSGRKGLVIGMAAFLVPFIITIPTTMIMAVYVQMNAQILRMLPAIAITQNLTSFHVVACLLADLKLLNSEIGRLAISSSMISTLASWNIMVLLVSIRDSVQSVHSAYDTLLRVLSIALLFLLVVYAMRPIMIWMIKRTPEGSNNMKEVHVFIIFMMVLVTSLLGQMIGYSASLGPVVLGLAVPPGPPLAETIEDKLDTIVTSIWLPLCYVTVAGTARSSLDMTQSGVTAVGIIILVAFFAKIIGAVLPALYYDVPLRDALVLGILIGSQGVVDILHFKRLLTFEIVDIEVFSIMTYGSVVLSGVTSLLVKFMCRPSTQYMVYKRAIQDDIRYTDFRILACVYGQLNAPSIMDLLEASYPTNESPINLYLLHLIELKHIAPPLLLAHKDNYSSIHNNHTRHIINAFRYFGSHYGESMFSLNSFTAMSPCRTMHQDICSVAYDKRTSLIILPFHRQINFDGFMESMNHIRTVNCNVLKTSPCSVGILIDRSGGNARNIIWEVAKSERHVSVAFLGGADDRGVLAYCMRMAEHPYTKLTVLRLWDMDGNCMSSKDTQLDAKLLNEFKQKFLGSERVRYWEVVVSDGVGIVKAMRSLMENRCDLMILGRQHSCGSKLLKGLTEWNEFPELGFMGDLVATLDSQDKFSILVLQQSFQPSEGDWLLQSFSHSSFSLPK